MADKISGADLTVGMVIKVSGRLYELLDIDPDDIGSKFDMAWWVRETNGQERELTLFADSDYEVRKSPAKPRPRIVKVRAADLEQLLRVASYDAHVSATGEAVKRLREAMTG